LQWLDHLWCRLNPTDLKTWPDELGNNKFEYSPYGSVKTDYENLSVPMLFTEFGCHLGDFKTSCPYKGGRTWPDVKLFFQDNFNEILSGAIAYTYEQDYEEYGLVLTPGFLKGQDSLYFLDSYYALQKQYKKYSLSDEWDATPADLSDPDWMPKTRSLHKRPTCPTKKEGFKVQKKYSTSEKTDWHKLPPTPNAPLANIGGQSECPSDQSDARPAARDARPLKALLLAARDAPPLKAPLTAGTGPKVHSSSCACALLCLLSLLFSQSS